MVLGPQSLRAMIVWEAHRMHLDFQQDKIRLVLSKDELQCLRLIKACEVCQSDKHGATESSTHRQQLFASIPWQLESIESMD